MSGFNFIPCISPLPLHSYIFGSVRYLELSCNLLIEALMYSPYPQLITSYVPQYTPFAGVVIRLYIPACSTLDFLESSS